jgi:hypothetical protein
MLPHVPEAISVYETRYVSPPLKQVVFASFSCEEQPKLPIKTIAPTIPKTFMPFLLFLNENETLDYFALFNLSLCFFAPTPTPRRRSRAAICSLTERLCHAMVRSIASSLFAVPRIGL